MAELVEGFATVPEDDGSDDPAWPIPGFIHPGLTALTAQPEMGKTTLLKSMVKGLLAGEWLGEPTHFDDDKRILFGCEDYTSFRDVRRTFADEPRVHPVLLHEWKPAWLPRLVSEGQFGMLIIDSLGAVVTDTNEQGLAGVFTQSVRQLPIPVIVVHHEARASKGPSGAQVYRGAYRHTIRVSCVEHDGDRILRLALQTYGNNAPASRRSVKVDRLTLVSEAADDSGRGVSRSTRKASAEKACILGVLAREQGVDVQLDHNRLAEALLGGKQGREDEGMRARVEAALDSPARHRTVSDLIRKNRAAFDRSATDVDRPVC
ncbi:ATP-binding protein [Jatrophihabitans telluris]|uniref:ATP-binding protein n=1 Tax=Jatrophihabitans telluris TaxID=2038343 RepID=A0ABY4QZW3_9ACTN|nr:ATP-binding protein [Jatrophihabitans telluris]UQX89201.1 ATP-binding protein [Jatrophihabitans telluris]